MFVSSSGKLNNASPCRFFTLFIHVHDCIFIVYRAEYVFISMDVSTYKYKLTSWLVYLHVITAQCATESNLCADVYVSNNFLNAEYNRLYYRIVLESCVSRQSCQCTRYCLYFLQD